MTVPAEIVKSTKWKSIGEEVAVVGPWAAVTVTVKSTAVPDVHESVEVCGEVPNVTLVGLIAQLRPAGVED
jgi:hypothetical protein